MTKGARFKKIFCKSVCDTGKIDELHVLNLIFYRILYEMYKDGVK